MKALFLFFKQVSILFQGNQIRWLPIWSELKGYEKQAFRQDLGSGLNVALMAFPQCMAYAIIAGLPVYFGILCYVAAALVGSVFTDSRYNSHGPSNATAVLMLGSFLTLGLTGQDLIYAAPVLVMLTGLFLVIGAFANVARLIQYISRTVIIGYITAAAMLIMVNQVNKVLGFSIPKSSSFVGILLETMKHITETHWPSLTLGIATYALYYVLSRKLPKLPNVAVILVIMSLVAFLMEISGNPVRTLESISMDFWHFTGFPFDVNLISQLATPALALAFLIMLEANSIGKSLASRAGQQFNSNQEMFGLGLANIASGLSGGMAASASLTRSLLNFNSKPATSLSNAFAGLIVGGLFVGLSPLIRYIPVPSLAVVVITIGISLISRHQIRIVSRATRSDAIVFYVTLIAGLLLALDTAIYLGAAVSIILFLKKVAEPELVEYSFNEEGQLTELDETGKRPNPEISIVHVEGELFFGAAELFYNQTRRVVADPNLKILILKLRNAHRLDATAVFALEELVAHMREKDRYLLVSEVRKDALRIFKNSGLLENIGRDNLFPDNVQNPTLSTAKALKRAKILLGGEEAKISIYVDSAKAAESKPSG